MSRYRNWNKTARRNRNHPFLLIVLVYLHSINWINANNENINDDSGPLSEVQTAIGINVSLPCELMPNTMVSDDKVTLVLWYKDGEKPIYTFDARGTSLHEAKHWWDTETLGDKAYFHYNTNPPALRIRNVHEAEQGLYKCRVDFKKNPTKNSRINLKVLVPPTHLTILDTNGAAIHDLTVGPYTEGASINLTCLSSGGKPAPRVSWWKEHALLDESYDTLPDGTVKNVLHLHRISRKDLNSVYTCQASNGHVLPPLSKTIKLEMILQPLFVRLQGLNHPLTAGVSTTVTCASSGARPPPQILWHKGGVEVRGTQSTSPDGNNTISQLNLIPLPEDNEKQVTCSVATEPKLNNGFYLKDYRTLDVKHTPIVSLNFGSRITDPNNLRSGDDVYLECQTKANPPVKKVEWYHNNRIITPSGKIFVSNQTLVLQNISKSLHGQYFCRASNAQGSVSSNDVHVDVKYAPVCKAESTVIRAALKQTIRIPCDVDANPLYNLTYKWHFNNSLETIVELPEKSSGIMMTTIQPSALPSSAVYLPNQQKKKINRRVSRRALSYRRSSNGEWPFDDEDLGDYVDGVGDDNDDGDDDDDDNSIPYTQMLVVNRDQLKRKYHPQQQQQQHHMMNTKGKHDSVGENDTTEKGKHLPHSSHHNQHHQQQLNNVYEYYVETYESFGAVSCVASNSNGNSQPCWYHLQPADLPDPIKNCTSFNATANSIQIQCIPGYDGGIQQFFHVQIYDELNRQILYNTSYKYPDFTIKRLPSDSVFVIRVTSINLQGPSKTPFRLRGRTLPAPLLRTASSTAVLVQLTPLLGALVGVMGTLILVAICIIIFLKIRTKRPRNAGEQTQTETDKGSAEPLSRNMGSHSSLEDKNPDIIPTENSEDEYNLEEKAFDRLNIDSQRILYTPPRLNSASPPPSISPAFGKPQYNELSLTTNPSYALYSNPLRTPTHQNARSVYDEPPAVSTTLLSSARSPPNIYTRIPHVLSSYLPAAYETRTSPTSPYGTTTTTSSTCMSTLPLLSKPIQTSVTTSGTVSNHYHSHPQSSLLINGGGSILGNYDETS
ncbi:hypothetical protein ACFFRR_008764 [Megaselia abdita]